METIETLRQKCDELKLKIHPNLTVDEISRMQLETLNFASSLTWPIYKARLREFRSQADARAAYTRKFLLSLETSDRKKEADAKSNDEVREEEEIAFSAEAERKLIEDLKEDFKTLHYSLRAMLKDGGDNMRNGM